MTRKKEARSQFRISKAHLRSTVTEIALTWCKPVCPLPDRRNGLLHQARLRFRPLRWPAPVPTCKNMADPASSVIQHKPGLKTGGPKSSKLTPCKVKFLPGLYYASAEFPGARRCAPLFERVLIFPLRSTPCQSGLPSPVLLSVGRRHLALGT